MRNPAMGTRWDALTQVRDGGAQRKQQHNLFQKRKRDGEGRQHVGDTCH
jgi:hypothetical protein